MTVFTCATPNLPRECSMWKAGIHPGMRHLHAALVTFRDDAYRKFDSYSLVKSEEHWRISAEFASKIGINN